MEKKKECRIIEDLLPNYIEGLTNEVTNKFVEEHLEECASCQNEKQKMTEKIETKVVHNQQIEIDYMKKEKLKYTNIAEYVSDITRYVERMALNKYMLQRNFYIVFSYNKSELATTEKFTEQAIKEPIIPCALVYSSL